MNNALQSADVKYNTLSMNSTQNQMTNPQQQHWTIQKLEWKAPTIAMLNQINSKSFLLDYHYTKWVI